MLMLMLMLTSLTSVQCACCRFRIRMHSDRFIDQLFSLRILVIRRHAVAQQQHVADTLATTISPVVRFPIDGNTELKYW